MATPRPSPATMEIEKEQLRDRHGGSVFNIGKLASLKTSETEASSDIKSSSSVSSLQHLQSPTQVLHKVTRCDVETTGKLLGFGPSFQVLEVKDSSSIVSRLLKSDDALTHQAKITNANVPSKRTWTSIKQQHHKTKSDKKNHQYYVIKTPRLDTNEKLNSLLHSVSDLHKEGQILNNLSHKNIVRMYASSFGDEEPEEEEETTNQKKAYTFSTSLCSIKAEDNFIVLEKLNETLLDKLNTWKQHSRYHCSLQKPVIEKRCQMLIELSEAVKYVHSRNIIHRDLKPTNIGFDTNGRLKVFDFGASKIMPSHTANGGVKDDGDDEKLYN